MKTINELNSKIWYRLLKIIYIFVFIVISIFIVFLVIDSYKPQFDNQKSYIICDNGKELKLTENDINLYSEYIWDNDDKKIKQLCTKDFRDELIEKYGSIGVGTTLTQDEFNKLYRDNYKLIPSYTTRDWVKTIGFSFLSIIIIFLIFEFIKRIFYYIVLGTFRPRK